MPNFTEKIQAMSAKETSGLIKKENTKGDKLETVHSIVEEKAKQEKEIPPTEIVMDVYNASKEAEGVELTKQLLWRAMEKQGILHFGKATEFENPAFLPTGGELNSDPPRFWKKEVEILHPPEKGFMGIGKKEARSEKTNEMLVICQLNEADDPEDVAMVITQVKHDLGVIEEALLTATMTKAEFDRLDTEEIDEQIFGTPPLAGMELARKELIKGRTTAARYKNVTVKNAIGMTLDEYNKQRDVEIQTARLGPEPENDPAVTRAQLRENFEKKFTLLLPQLNKKMSEAQNNTAAEQQALQAKVEELKNKPAFIYALHKCIQNSGDKRDRSIELLLMQFGITREMAEELAKATGLATKL